MSHLLIATPRRWRNVLVLASLLSLAAVTTALAAIAPAFLVKDINSAAGASGSAFPFVSAPGNPRTVSQKIVIIANVAYFAADDGVHGRELWKSDGTSATLVKDINLGAGDSNPDWLTNFNGVLYFVANNGANGVELWKSDGTDGGTTMVMDINAGAGDANPSNLAAVGGKLFFAASNGAASCGRRCLPRGACICRW